MPLNPTAIASQGTMKEPTFPSDRPVPLLNKTEMAHDSSRGAEGSPQQTPSPPHAPHLPAPESSFHQQIMQSQNPRKNHIAERAKQSLENSFLIQLKKQQQLQQEILLQHFQQQRQQLAEQHEQQLRHHLKLWEQQKAMEEAALREAREAREARERHERDRVELMRKKDKHECSANASTQVKQKLQEFLKKKQAAANSNGTVPGSPYRNWGIVKSSSGESITSTGATATAHPYRPLPLTLNAAPPPASPSDYPLRKTASEPNMLKLRLKARVIERRASPLARRPNKPRLKNRNCDGGSPRTSPPGGAPVIREEQEPGGAPDLLFSSPSMPNISLGRAPPQMPAATTAALPAVREASPAPAPPGSVAPAPAPAPPGSARLGKRPLGRTHSAPLPLGDPALQPAALSHHYLRDQIRKTVLTRAHDAATSLREEEGEVIDLTSRRRSPPRSPPRSPRRSPPVAAPLARALSSPLVRSVAPTGLAYDPIMLKHGCLCGAHAPTHPEHGGRLQSVWARLCETGLVARTERTRSRKATVEELQSVHTAAHVAAYMGRGPTLGAVRLACGGVGVDADTAWSDAHTPPAARHAAAAVLDLALRAARDQLSNGFAVVRPPGHHAEAGQAMGFCFFNSVAIAARVLQTKLRLQRILIVDWDVHHGNGTQQIFYSDPGVLYMSLHRHDDGNFFPGTGAASEAGAGPGLGYNVNVAWGGHLDPALGDAEYMAAFRCIVMPIAKSFDPEIVLVSCGFDAAAGHPPPLGGYQLSPACFAHMTSQLMQLANGKVVMALEGGYDLAGVCDCAQATVAALLGDRPPPMPPAELTRRPHQKAVDAMLTTIAVHHHHWPELKRWSGSAGLPAAACGAMLAAARLGRLQTERDAADTARALATLSMQHARPRSPDSSRSVSEEPMEQDEGK